MFDWYYHDPGAGRVGPFTADELRKRFHERRIRHDTLVWHHGLREWQPLQCMAEELGLDQLQPDASQPPPLAKASPPPIPVGTAASPTIRTVARGKYSRTPLRSRKTLSAGAIAGIVIAVLAIPAMLVLAAVVVPSYKDYVLRADSMGGITGTSIAMKRMVSKYAFRNGSCPNNSDPRVAQLKDEIRQRAAVGVRFDDLDGGCMFELTFHADGKLLDGKTLRYEGYPDGDEFLWDCSGGSLPEEYRPYECRSE